MDLQGLDDLIYNLGIDPTDQQFDQLYNVFKDHFVDNPFKVNGLKVKVILKNSNVPGFTSYPETFVHLITRKGQEGKRVFDRHRANKIHWIKCILENKDDEQIVFFKYKEADGSERDYYWYKEGDFLVIMEAITPDYLIITSFHIDDRRNREYFEKRLK